MSNGLRVNFSGKEASSEARSVELLPRGAYHVAITDIETRESQSEKNFGKPYWAVEMTVQDGPHENRKLWGNVMLFEGALYSLSQLLKATGYYDGSEGEIELPSADELVGKQLVVNVVQQKGQVKPEDKQDTPGERYPDKNEIKGYKAFDPNKPPTAVAATSGGKGKSSLMP